MREGARSEVARDIMGHANIDVTQHVYDKSWWEERADAVTQADETVPNAAQNAEVEAKKNQPESVSNACGFTLQVAIGESLVPRIRHCVECPNCHILYLVSLSPYRNGSYLMPTMRGSSQEYALYCSCRRGSAARVWRWSEMKACEISKAAYDRGYGTRDEVVSIDAQPRNVRAVDVSECLDDLNATKNRKNPR